MNDNEQNPILAFIGKLIVIFRIFAVIIMPFIMYAHSKQLRQTLREEKTAPEHRKYIKDILKMYFCLSVLYVIVFYHLIQDFIPNHAVVVFWLDVIVGIPGIIYYYFTDNSVLAAGDPTAFIVVTITIFVIGFGYYFFKVQVLWRKDADFYGNWIPNAETVRKQDEYYNQQEAEFRKAMAAKVAHDWNHPEGDKDVWDKMSTQEQEDAERVWDEKNEQLSDAMSRCPRADCYSKK